MEGDTLYRCHCFVFSLLGLFCWTVFWISSINLDPQRQKAWTLTFAILQCSTHTQFNYKSYVSPLSHISTNQFVFVVKTCLADVTCPGWLLLSGWRHQDDGVGLGVLGLHHQFKVQVLCVLATPLHFGLKAHIDEKINKHWRLRTRPWDQMRERIQSWIRI